jgi:membrane protein
MYKLLPDVKIAWKDVWIGAVVTAFLFTIGKFLIGFYLGRSGTSSVYGAAGTMVAILLWVYYAAQVFLLGAEFTYVYATRCGSRCGQPAPDKGQVRNARDESTGAAETPEQQPGRGARASRAH